MLESNNLLDQNVDDFTGENIQVENQSILMSAKTSEPPGPGVMTYCFMKTQNRHFNANLAGTNLLELTFEEYNHGEEFLCRYLTLDGAARDQDDPLSGHYLMGFCLAIGSMPELVGKSNGSAGRVVQIHFDWYSKLGLWFTLNRNIVSGDEEKYPYFAREREGRILKRGEIPVCPFMTKPGNSVSLAVSRPFVNDVPCGYRWGLGLADDANTLFWTLNAKVMDTVDITGFFNSSPVCVEKGAFITIAGGGGYRENLWNISGVKVRVSR
ncbi:MAG: hypothetical protein WC975_02350 [Phycisphaerae bacterium]